MIFTLNNHYYEIKNFLCKYVTKLLTKFRKEVHACNSTQISILKLSTFFFSKHIP